MDILANTTAQKLNDGFGVDVFEAVDYSEIPVKQGNYGKEDDWWATKYKVIVLYEIEPSYQAYYKTNTSTGDREFIAKMNVFGEVILRAAEDAKKNRLKYVTSSPKTWGTFRSEPYIGSSGTEVLVIQELKALINPPSDEEIIQELIKTQQPKLDKLVKKLSK